MPRTSTTIAAAALCALLRTAEGQSPDAAPSNDAFVSDHLGKLAAACAKQRIDPWCRATEYARAKRGEAPAAGTRLGVTSFVVTAGVDPASLEKHRRLSSLAARSDGDKVYALVASVSPRNPTGQQEVARLLPLVLAQIEGGPTPEVKEPGMSQYLEGLPSRASYPLAPQPTGWSVQGGSNADLRRVGDVWVAVEVPRNNPAGIWLSVFPAK
jgi:hypothetical protein